MGVLSIFSIFLVGCQESFEINREEVDELRKSDEFFSKGQESEEMTEGQLLSLIEESVTVEENTSYSMEGEVYLFDFQTQHQWVQTINIDRVSEDEERYTSASKRNDEEWREWEHYVNLEQEQSHTYRRGPEGQWEAVMRPELYSSPSYQSYLAWKAPESLVYAHISTEGERHTLLFEGEYQPANYHDPMNADLRHLLGIPFRRARDEEGEVIYEASDRFNEETANLRFKAVFNEETSLLESVYYELEQAEDLLYIYEMRISEVGEIESIHIPEEALEEATSIMPY